MFKTLNLRLNQINFKHIIVKKARGEIIINDSGDGNNNNVNYFVKYIILTVIGC